MTFYFYQLSINLPKFTQFIHGLMAYSINNYELTEQFM